MNYTVKNVYGIQGESKHRTPEAACRAARKREGDGWIVEDAKGGRYTMDGDRAVMVSKGGGMMNDKQGEQSILHMVIPREKKGLYVKASRARGAKLVDWVTGHLDRCAAEDIEADEGVREDWDNRFNR